MEALREEFEDDVKPGTKRSRSKPLAADGMPTCWLPPSSAVITNSRAMLTSCSIRDLLFAANGELIPNYPQKHSANCTAKHKATLSRFKPMVRILKNLRGKLVDNGTIHRAARPRIFLKGCYITCPMTSLVEATQVHLFRQSTGYKRQIAASSYVRTSNTIC